MNTAALKKQYEELEAIYDNGICDANEWYSVGMAPPAEIVNRLKAVARKMARIARQLKIDWDV